MLWRKYLWWPFKKKLYRPTLGNFLFSIVVPGILTLYLVFTEKAFIEAFENEVGLVLFGEAVYMFTHMSLVYMILPVVWFLDFMIFVRVYFFYAEIYQDIFNWYAKMLYIVLILLTLSRFLTPLLS